MTRTALKPSGQTEYECNWPKHKFTWNGEFRHWVKLEQLIGRISLPVEMRDDWDVKIEPAMNYVRFRGDVIDVDNGTPAVISHRFVPPGFHKWDEAFWIRWILDRCLDIQRHELCETFLVDGMPIYKPHDPMTGQGHYTVKLVES